MTRSNRTNGPDPVLPFDRVSLRDRHHLAWPGERFEAWGLEGFRNAPCVSARSFDSMVHSVIHMLYGGFIEPKQRVGLSDLRARANKVLDSHDRRRCGCFDPRQKVLVGALSLRPLDPRTYTGPPCVTMSVDAHVLGIMSDYYVRDQPTTDALRVALTQRCEAGDCACWVPDHRDGPVRRYPGWHPLATT